MNLVVIKGRDIDLPLVTQVGLVRSHSAYRLTWHSHQGFELLFLLDGMTEYEFRNGPSVDVPGGHFLVVKPGAIHRGVHDVRMPSRICGVVLDPNPQKHWRQTPFTKEELRRIIGYFQKAAMAVHPFNRDLKRLVARLSDNKLHGGATKDPLAKATLRSLVCAAVLEAAHQLIIQRAPKLTEIAGAAVAYLRENSQETIRMADLVRHMGFSRARLFQLFKASMGLTPNDYLQRVRIEKAQASLRSTNQSITDIALAAGFNSSQYFSTVFRRYTGVTPGRYRLKYSK